MKRNTSMCPLSLFAWLVLIIVSLPGTMTKASPKGAILFIGDGMGVSTIGAARIQKHGTEGPLFLDTLPYTAFVKTYSADNLVTDSAASATAMATGHKTNNGFLSQSPHLPQNTGKRLKTIAELAKKKGHAVGIVTTTDITHATPAAFYAHVDDRNKTAKIAEQLLHSPIDLFLGGGAQNLNSEALKQ